MCPQRKEKKKICEGQRGAGIGKLSRTRRKGRLLKEIIESNSHRKLQLQNHSLVLEGL